MNLLQRIRRWPPTEVGDQNRRRVGVRIQPRDDATILIVTDAGYGKRTKLEHFTRKSRGIQGVKGIKLTARRGFMVAAFMVGIDDELFVINSGGTTARIAVRQISSQGRDATGVRVVALAADQTVAAVAPVLSSDDEA